MRLNLLLLILLLLPVVSASTISFDRDSNGILSEEDLDYWIAGVEFDLFPEQGLLYLIDSLPRDGEFSCKTENCLDIPLYTSDDNLAQQRTLFILQGLGIVNEEEKINIPEPSAFFLNLIKPKVIGFVSFDDYNASDDNDVLTCFEMGGNPTAYGCFFDNNDQGGFTGGDEGGLTTGTDTGGETSGDDMGATTADEQGNEENPTVTENNILGNLWSGIFGNPNNQNSNDNNPGNKQPNSLNNKGPSINPGIWNPPQSGNNNQFPIYNFPYNPNDPNSFNTKPGIIISGPNGPGIISAQITPGQTAPNGYIISIGITGNAINPGNALNQVPAGVSNQVSVPYNSCYAPSTPGTPTGCSINTANGCSKFGWQPSCQIIQKPFPNTNPLPSCSSGAYPCDPSVGNQNTICPVVQCSPPPVNIWGQSCKPINQKSTNGCKLCPQWDCSTNPTTPSCPVLSCPAQQPAPQGCYYDSPPVNSQGCQTSCTGRLICPIVNLPNTNQNPTTPSCPKLICAKNYPIAPQGCYYDSPSIDSNGCQTSCTGSLICPYVNTGNVAKQPNNFVGPIVNLPNPTPNPVPPTPNCPKLICAAKPQIVGKICEPIYTAQAFGSCPSCPQWDCRDEKPKCNNVVCPKVPSGCTISVPGGKDPNGCEICASFTCPPTQQPPIQGCTVQNLENSCKSEGGRWDSQGSQCYLPNIGPVTLTCDQSKGPNCGVPPGCTLKDPNTCSVDCPVANPNAICQQDVQLCSDGSYVTRDPLMGCSFKQCPANNPTNVQITIDTCTPKISPCSDGSYIITGINQNGQSCTPKETTGRTSCPLPSVLKKTDFLGICINSQGLLVNCGTGLENSIVYFQGKCMELYTGTVVSSKLCNSPVSIKN